MASCSTQALTCTKSMQNEELESSDEQWQMSKLTLRQQNEYLLKTGEYSDCVFIVGFNDSDDKKKFKCHRLLLSKASYVFGAMLFGPLAEKGEIFVTDVKPDIFQTMLVHIYTERLELQNYTDAMDLCIVADKYMILNLKNECIKKLSEDMNPTNIFQVHRLAKLLDLHKLEQKAVKMVLECTDQVLASPSFDLASEDQLLMIVTQDSLNIKSEAYLIAKCLYWGKIEAERKGLPNTTEGIREALGIIFQHLRFLALTPKEFSNIAENSNVLLDKEKWECVFKIIQKDFGTTLVGFSSKFESRDRIEIPLPNFTFSENKSVQLCSELCSGSNSYIEEDIFGNRVYSNMRVMNHAMQRNRNLKDGGFLCSIKFSTDCDMLLIGFVTASNLSDNDTIVVNGISDTVRSGKIVVRTGMHNNCDFKLCEPILLHKDRICTLILISQQGVIHKHKPESYTLTGLNDKNAVFALNKTASVLAGFKYRKV